jgi:predicted RNA methylase
LRRRKSLKDCLGLVDHYKANYRDAIYFSYGWKSTERLHQFVSDLGAVSGNFSLMAAHFVARRVVIAAWEAYAADMMEYSQFDLPYELDEI